MIRAKYIRTALRVSAAACAVAAMPSPAFAQDTETQEDQGSSLGNEIVVTANKRAQSAQDVGISVTAFSGEQLSDLGATSSLDIVNFTPNAEVLSTLGPGQNANLVIRGVGLAGDFNNANEAPVTAYVDEFYLISLSTLDFLMHDIERAEVLRGPQGTLFGRNSNGGLFHFITKKPSQELEAFGQVTYSEFNDLKIEAAVGGPFTDRLRGRLSFSRQKNTKGFQNNQIAGVPDGDQRHVWSVRGQLEWDATDDITMLLKYDHAEVENILPAWENNPSFVNPATGLEEFIPANMDINGTGPGNDFFGFRGSGIPNQTFNGAIATVQTETDHLLFNFGWNFGDVTLTSITGWMDVNKNYFDGAVSGGPIIGIGPLGLGDRNEFGNIYDTNYLTQEIRLQGDHGDLRWTAGFYYLDQEIRETGGVNLFGAGDFVTLGFLTQPFPIVGQYNYQQSAESYAGFGQIEYDLSNQFTFIAGARVSKEKKAFSMDYKIADPFDVLALGIPVLNTEIPVSIPIAYPFNQNTVGNLARLSDTLWTGKIELDWKPNDDVLVYASASRGQKVGGFNNGQVPFILPQDVQFGAETLYAYELGLKATFLDGNARFNASTFYYDYQDFQAFAFEGLGSVTSNNDARIFGAEADLFINPVDNLDLLLGVSFLDTKIKNLDNGVLVRNTEMASSPKFTLFAMARYVWPIGDNDLAAQVDVNHVGKRFYDSVNHPVTQLESFTKVNARLSFGSSDDTWEAAIFVKNLTDEQNSTVRFPLAANLGMSQSLSATPRQFGGQITFRY